MRHSYLCVVFMIFLAAALTGFAQNHSPGLVFGNGSGEAHIGVRCHFKCEMNSQFPRPFIDVVCLAAFTQHMGWNLPAIKNDPIVRCELMPDALFMLTYFYGHRGPFFRWGCCIPISLDPPKYGYYNWFNNWIDIPNDRALIGIKFVVQAYAVDPYPTRHYPTLITFYATTVPQTILIKE